MIAHKPQGQTVMQQVVGGVGVGGPNVGQMQRQQHPQQQQPPTHQMAHHHHPTGPQHNQHEQPGYYGTNEQYSSGQQLYQDHHHQTIQQQLAPPQTQTHHHHHHNPHHQQQQQEQQNPHHLHTAPTNTRFAPGPPQHHKQQQYHPQQQQQPLQQAQPQVPPHQLPHQPGGYNGGGGGGGVVDHSHQHQQLSTGFTSAGVEPVVGLHPSPQRAGQQASGRPQMHQQAPLTPYANQQQTVPVRPSNVVQTNRIMNRQQQQQQHQPQPQQPLPPIQQQQQQQQVYKHNQPLQQNPHQNQLHNHTTSIPHHQHQPQHHAASTSSYPNQHSSGPYQAHQPNQSTAFMSDPMMEQYSSSSPGLLQQQLNRQRPVPPTQPAAPGAPIQRPMPAGQFGPMGPTKARPQIVGGPPGHPLPPPVHMPPGQQGGRFCGADPQVQEIPLVESYVDQQPAPPPGHTGRPMVANNAGPYNQSMNHRMQPQQQRASTMRPLPAIQQQQPMPPTMDNHLIGNPTPPLTPNASNAPHLRQNVNMTGPDDWPQQSHHDHLSPSGAYHNGLGPMVNGHPPVMQHQQRPQQPPSGLGHAPQPNSIVAPIQQQSSQRGANIPKTTTPSSYHHQQQQHQPHPPQSSSQHNPHHHRHQHQHQHQQPAQPMMAMEPNQQQPQQAAGPPVVRPTQLTNHRASSGAEMPNNNNNNGQSIMNARLTLPLRDAPLLGPFKLDHEAQFTSKMFQIEPQLFDILAKSMNLANHQTAAVIRELQFRAHLVNSTNMNKGNGDSLLASNNHHHHHYNNYHQSTTSAAKSCNWPDSFQVSVNQQEIYLDRSKQAHKPADVFQFCHLGDNVLDIQVNDCYCNHEFVLEAVDRPTLRAFMNSCFKSRLMPQETCIQRVKANFGSPGFCVQNAQLQAAGMVNEYVSDNYNQQQHGGSEQVRARISLRCPISGKRMRTPTRGHNCKHLQCFDLENFLYSNRERSQWNCPICSLAIPFNMLDLDQHQINILHSIPETTTSNADILMDNNGQWQICNNQQPLGGANNVGPVSHHHSTAKSTGTFHPQPPFGSAAGSPNKHHQSRHTPTGPHTPSSPASWDQNTSGSPLVHQLSESPLAGGVKRPVPTAMSPQVANGRRSANGSPLAKRPCGGQYASAQPPMNQSPSGINQHQQQSLLSQSVGAGDNSDELSPLEAMERTIIQHEQQMGPPPFDPSSLTSNPSRNNSQAAAQTGPTGPLAPAHLHSPTTPAANHNQQQQQQQQQQQVPMVQPSPESRANVFSPASCHHAGSSPAGARQPVPASPHHQQPPPQSPMQQQHHQTSTSMPATPSSAVLILGGPETPATPGNPSQQQQQQQPPFASHSPHVNSSIINGGQPQQQPITGVDHQPLSNGSASAGSITSSSTMTPSGQSLGSVGMGGDSRCNTAPLQGNPGLDELILPGGSNANINSSSNQYAKQMNPLQDGTGTASGSAMDHHQLDEKSEILMSKLMMDSSDESSMLHRNGDLAMALEEAEWKQQLDRGKSEHLANFLNEPLMNKKHHHLHHHHHHNHLDQFQHQPYHPIDEGANKMLSGGLNPSDDDEEANQSHGSSPDGANMDQMDQFASCYLDGGAADEGAGLPPDDSILDLFER